MMGYKTIIGPTEPTRYDDVLAYSLDFGVITKLFGREIGFLFLLGFSWEMCFMVVYFAMKMSCVCIDGMSLWWKASRVTLNTLTKKRFTRKWCTGKYQLDEPGTLLLHALPGFPSSIHTALDLVMIAARQLQCIFPIPILINPEVEPHAPNTYQSKLVPGGSINSNKCEGSTSRPWITIQF